MEFRFVVTQKCNFRCVYCHAEGMRSFPKERLTADDYAFIYQIGRIVRGVNSATLTGGEPTLRQDVIEIAAALVRVGCAVTMITNGFLLGEKMDIGKYLTEIHISLGKADDSWNKITRTKSHRKVLANIIEYRRRYPNKKMVLNVVLVPGVNTDAKSLLGILKLAKKHTLKPKLIYQLDGEREDVEPALLELGAKFVNGSTRKRVYDWKGTPCEIVECICTVAHRSPNPVEICKKYQDLFISPDGKIKPCMLRDYTIPILEEVKNRDSRGLEVKLAKAEAMFGMGCGSV